MSILVSDLNDMPPVFTKEEWVTEVSEGLPETQTAILTVAVIDQDETNDFYYKVTTPPLLIEQMLVFCGMSFVIVGYGFERFMSHKNVNQLSDIKLDIY